MMDPFELRLDLDINVIILNITNKIQPWFKRDHHFLKSAALKDEKLRIGDTRSNSYFLYQMYS